MTTFVTGSTLSPRQSTRTDPSCHRFTALHPDADLSRPDGVISHDCAQACRTDQKVLLRGPPCIGDHHPPPRGLRGLRGLPDSGRVSALGRGMPMGASIDVIRTRVRLPRPVAAIAALAMALSGAAGLAFADARRRQRGRRGVQHGGPAQRLSSLVPGLRWQSRRTLYRPERPELRPARPAPPSTRRSRWSFPTNFPDEFFYASADSQNVPDRRVVPGRRRAARS